MQYDSLFVLDIQIGSVRRKLKANVFIIVIGI